MQYKTLQYDLPVFVRTRHYPIIWRGKTFKYNDLFPWKEMHVPENVVETMFNLDKLYHNEDLEKEIKVGDRLVEMDREQLASLVRLVNDKVKKDSSSNDEFNKYKIKGSTVEDKQRGLIRTWLHRVSKKQDWVDHYYSVRDDILEA